MVSLNKFLSYQPLHQVFSVTTFLIRTLYLNSRKAMFRTLDNGLWFLMMLDDTWLLVDIWCCSCMQISWLKVRFKLIKYVCSVEFSSICHLASQTSFIEHKPILSISNRFQQFHLSIHGSFRFREYDHGNGLYFANFYHKSSNITSFCESHFSVFILLYKSISNLLSIQLKKF